ncbi:MAG: Asp-tRNA(Asn)/Glu-tRNA(Gln) amidotransferase subunit GatA [Caldiserica bacterium]|nr:Asp-tRNA(Asn)/Glu-tRNA(Gln) amidotransferase subunit GatA [Caldisericota bacterium]
MSKLSFLPAHVLSEKVRKGELSFSDITTEVIAQLEAKDKSINAYISRRLEAALEEAKSLDESLAKGEDLPSLAGIPLAVKDNICTRGFLTTCASKILYNFVPPYNATVVEKIKKEKMIIIGKTNMDEFAMGSSTENSYFGTTHNPWDYQRVPGGSSGGSTAAVAAGEAIMALGSDTGGSIRQPASFCSVTGLKPTYGRVSRYGLVAFASSLDQIGPIARDVQDAYLLLKIIGGYDPCDSTSLPLPLPEEQLTGKVKGKILGLPKEYLSEGIDPKVKEIVEKAIKVWEEMGCVIKEITLPHTKYSVATYYIVAPCEASSNLARYDGVQYGFRNPEYTITGQNPVIDMMEETRDQGFGSEVKRRIMLGTFTLSHGYFEAYYLKAQKVRTLIKEDFEKAFQSCDFIVTPVSPTPPFKIGEKVSDPLKMYLSDIFTIPVNLAGLPAISIPGGFTEQNLPVGVQIIGKPLDEYGILNLGFAFQEATDFHKRTPHGN